MVSNGVSNACWKKTIELGTSGSKKEKAYVGM